MTSADISILVISPLLASLMAALEERYTVHKLWEQDDRNAYLQSHGKDIRGIVSTFVQGVPDSVLAQLPNIEIIASYGVGLDRINLATVKQRGLALSNTPNIQEPVADLALALLLSITRKVCVADCFIREGKWAQGAFPFGVSLQGKTCGIVGMGRIGQAIAKRAEAFGLKIAYYGPNKKPVNYPYYEELTELAKASDFLMLALPGGEETHHLINGTILKALGEKGFLINVARGSVVDEAALIQSLQNHEIAGAALDVFETEPLSESPLFALENVVLLPHIASATHETRREMGEVVMANLNAHFTGKPLLTPVIT